MRQVLALDGGGVRGVLELAFLERMEALLPHGEMVHHRFDLVGGTSTGAIIAACVALGMPISEIKELYFSLAPRVFKKGALRIPGIHTVFKADALRRELERAFGDVKLGSDLLKTGFAVVSKRMDTGSPWVLSNCKNAPYFQSPEDGSYIGNGEYSLVNVVRASTAAPHYFSPERIEVVKGAPPGLFVDGAVSPHNNPSLALFELATIPKLGFGWPVGADNLRVVSIGTGTYRQTLTHSQAKRLPAAGLAVSALASMIGDVQNHTLLVLQMLGRSLTPVWINSELGDMSDSTLLDEPLLEFVRYDVRLEHDWLLTNVGARFTERELAQLRDLGNPASMEVLLDIGRQVAAKSVSAEHFATSASGRTPAISRAAR